MGTSETRSNDLRAAAASFIGMVPVMAGFVLPQRFFVPGLTTAAAKGS